MQGKSQKRKKVGDIAEALELVFVVYGGVLVRKISTTTLYNVIFAIILSVSYNRNILICLLLLHLCGHILKVSSCIGIQGLFFLSENVFRLNKKRINLLNFGFFLFYDFDIFLTKPLKYEEYKLYFLAQLDELT